MRIPSQHNVKYFMLCFCSAHIYPYLSIVQCRIYSCVLMVVYFLFKKYQLVLIGQLLGSELLLLIPHNHAVK